MKTLAALLALLPLALRADAQAPWKAEVRIKVSGCTSCADCRASIRQISQSQSGIDKVEFKDNVVRIGYPDPARVKVLEVARALDGTELLRVKVARVELSVAGTLETRDGKPFLVASATGQSWLLSAVPEGMVPGRTFLVAGVLESWKDEKAEPVLSPRSADPF